MDGTWVDWATSCGMRVPCLWIIIVALWCGVSFSSSIELFRFIRLIFSSGPVAVAVAVAAAATAATAAAAPPFVQLR